MTPVVQLYWIRVALGIVAGLVTAFIAAFFGGVEGMTDSTTLINSITVALLIYFVTYYILRATYKNKIEKPSKILKHSNRHVLLCLDYVLRAILHNIRYSIGIRLRIILLFLPLSAENSR